MSDLSASDVAHNLLASGVQPGTDPLGDAFADPFATEDRLARAIVRAAKRELGVEIASVNAKALDYRQAAHLAATIGRTGALDMEVRPSPSLNGDTSQADTNTVSVTPPFHGVGQDSESTHGITPTSPAVTMISEDGRHTDRGEASRDDSPPAWTTTSDSPAWGP